jgi:hypothetical protein
VNILLSGANVQRRGNFVREAIASSSDSNQYP